MSNIDETQEQHLRRRGNLTGNDAAPGSPDPDSDAWLWAKALLTFTPVRERGGHGDLSFTFLLTPCVSANTKCPE